MREQSWRILICFDGESNISGPLIITKYDIYYVCLYFSARQTQYSKLIRKLEDFEEEEIAVVNATLFRPWR